MVINVGTLRATFFLHHRVFWGYVIQSKAKDLEKNLLYVFEILPSFGRLNDNFYLSLHLNSKLTI